MICAQGTGTLLELDPTNYGILTDNMQLLTKQNLMPMLLNLSPPMESQSKKSILNYIACFNLEVKTRGYLIANERDKCNATIVLKGDVMSYKRIVDMQSYTYREQE